MRVALRAVALCLALALCGQSVAGDLSTEQAVRLYVIAIKEMGVGIPKGRPVIHPDATSEDLRRMVCPGGTCTPRAAYLNGRLWLHEDMNFRDPYDAAVLVHEFVHHIQEWRAGGPSTDCAEHARREAEAHAIEERVLERWGFDGNVARRRMAFVHCQ